MTAIIRIAPKNARAKLVIENCVVTLNGEEDDGPDSISEIFIDGVYRNVTIRHNTFKVGKTEVTLDE